MALKRAILESVELLGYSSMNEKQIEAVTVFVCFCMISQNHTPLRNDALRTSVQKNMDTQKNQTMRV